VRPGDLVKVKSARLGVPSGILGLIMRSYDPRGDYARGTDEKIHELQFIGDISSVKSKRRRFLGRDLEIVK